MQNIMLAADTSDLGKVIDIARTLKDEPHFGGVKVGFSLALRYGLQEVVSQIRRVYMTGMVIYDHQKAGNDIPDTGADFAKIMAEAEVDGAILFPFTGPITGKAWIDALQKKSVLPIVGGAMTHEGFEFFINLDTSMYIYRRAAESGVTHFVVPGNKIEIASLCVKTATQYQYGRAVPTFYAPGLVTQGGDITDAGVLCGPNFTAIVGRAFLEAADPIEAFHVMAAKLI